MDAGYKRLFSHPEMVADLIRGYLDPRLAKAYDLESLERCNGSYVSPDLRERRSDVVWRMRSKHGWTYVYLLLEFQTTVDTYMAVRMLGYIALLWQDLIRQKQLDHAGLLPPVLPVVLYNGDRPWTSPLSLRPLIAPSPAFLAGMQPDLSYRFLDENRVPTTGGRLLKNLVAAIFALEQSNSLPGQQKVVRALRAWLKDPALRETIGTWYADALAPTGLLTMPKSGRITLDEVEPMMATRIMQDIKRQIAEGEAKGEARGEARGKAEGEAKGKIAEIRRLVSKGRLTVDAARAEIEDLIATKTIPKTLGREALGQLG